MRHYLQYTFPLLSLCLVGAACVTTSSGEDTNNGGTAGRGGSNGNPGGTAGALAAGGNGGGSGAPGPVTGACTTGQFFAGNPYFKAADEAMMANNGTLEIAEPAGANLIEPDHLLDKQRANNGKDKDGNDIFYLGRSRYRPVDARAMVFDSKGRMYVNTQNEIWLIDRSKASAQQIRIAGDQDDTENFMLDVGSPGTELEFAL